MKEALGVDPSMDWVDCSPVVYNNLLGDWVGNLALDLPIVLAEGIPVLIYSGTDDWICNYLGGKAWAEQMVWPGQVRLRSFSSKMSPAGSADTESLLECLQSGSLG